MVVLIVYKLSNLFPSPPNGAENCRSMDLNRKATHDQISKGQALPGFGMLRETHFYVVSNKDFPWGVTLHRVEDPFSGKSNSLNSEILQAQSPKEAVRMTPLPLNSMHFPSSSAIRPKELSNGLLDLKYLIVIEQPGRREVYVIG